MEREKIFRGQRTNNNEWVYGYYVKDPEGRHRIYLKPFEGATSNTYYFVIPETVGQHTGLKDKNGKEIYEDDILCNDEYQTWEWRGVVKFSHGVFGAEWVTNVKSQSMVGSWGQKHNLRKLDDDILERQIIVGNIHDNPELIVKPLNEMEKMKQLNKKEQEQLEQAFRAACNLLFASEKANFSKCSSFHINPFNNHWDKKTVKEVMYHVKLYLSTWVITPMQDALKEDVSKIKKQQQKKFREDNKRKKEWMSKFNKTP